MRLNRLFPWIALAGVLLVVMGQRCWFDRLDEFYPGARYALPGLFIVLLLVRPAALGLAVEPLLGAARPGLPCISWRWLLAGIGIVLCGYTAWRAQAADLNAWILLAGWALSVLLTMIGLIPPGNLRDWLRGKWRALRATRWTVVGLLLLFGLGLALRVAFLDSEPDQLAGDEAQFAAEAVHLKGKLDWVYNPFERGIWHHPHTVHTLMAVSIQAFDQTKFAARLPWAILGALTIPAIYLAGRRMFGVRVGWIAALFMATFPVHIQFSRTGMDMTGDPLFAALAFAFLTHALRDGDYVEGVLAGWAMGMTQYFYFAGRIVPLLLLAYTGFYLLRFRWQLVRARAGVLAVVLIVAVVTVFPHLYTMSRDEIRPLNPRLDAVSIWETGNVEAAANRAELPEYWLHQIQGAYMAYVQVHDESDVYGRYNPLLGWFGGVPFMLGLALVLRRWSDPRFLILGIWVLGTATLGGLLLVDPPHYPRYISATPAAALLVGLGVEVIACVVRDVVQSIPVETWRRLRDVMLYGTPRFDQIVSFRWRLPTVSATLSVALAVGNVGTYVWDYVPQTGTLLYGETTRELNDVVRIVNSFDVEYTVWYFSSLPLDMIGTDVLRYLLDERQGREFRGEIDEWYKYVDSGAHLFLIAPTRYNEVVGKLMHFLPGGELYEYINQRTGDTLVYAYAVRVEL